MNTRIKNIPVLLAMGFLASTLTGCGSLNHKKHVDAATGRWKAMRSTLILQMAQQQFDAGDLEQAEKTLAEAVQVDSANPRLYALMGRVAMERGQLERSYNRFKTAIKMQPRHAPAHYYQGVVMQRWAQFDAALISYQRAYEIEPDNAAYLLAMSEMMVVLDRTDEAMKLLVEKMAYFDMNAGIRLAIGQMYTMQGVNDKAARYIRQAALIRPDDLQIQAELALALLRAGQPAEAAIRLEQLSQEPSLAHRRDLARALAESYVAVGRIDQAKLLYIKMTRRHPMDADVWLKLGELALSQQDTAGAMLAAHRFKKLAPRRHEGDVLAGVVYSQQGQVEKALEQFDHAAQLAPDESTPVVLRGITLERRGQLNAAAKAYAEALRREPDDHRARRLLERVSGEVEQNTLTSD